MPMRLIRIAAPVSISVMLALLLGGCASTKEDVFPKDMKPMSEVYDRHFAKLGTRGIEGARGRLEDERTPLPVTATEPELVGYTREAHTEIEVLFPVLPNPQLLLYVYPHLGEDGAPVPGYATAFPLYERI